MARTFSERIAWHKAPETRRWKRRLQVIELIVMAAMVVTACVGFAIVDGPKRFEPMFYLFAGCMLASMAILVPFFLSDESVSRYVRSVLLLGLLSGAGCLAGFGFVVVTS